MEKDRDGLTRKSVLKGMALVRFRGAARAECNKEHMGKKSAKCSKKGRAVYESGRCTKMSERSLAVSGLSGRVQMEN